MPQERPKSNGKMSAVQDSFYARWRVQRGIISILREDRDSPPESLLQAIWQHQRLLRDRLVTLDGQPVRILHPGFQSLEGGPDFRQAVVQIADGPVRTGDIEVDLRASGWRAHGHDRNPAFKNVLLHVIWEGEKSTAGGPPAMELRGVLDAPLGELSRWFGGESALELPEDLRGRCCAPLRDLEDDSLQNLLREAAHVRLCAKASQFQARARQAGWEQSLWEGLLRALGYKHNVWPMQRLGELRPRWNGAAASALQIQSRLLGLSGLLPQDLTRRDAGTDRYLRQVWDQWWRERDEFSDAVLPRAAWRLSGIRPANHPQRRLALAAGWAMAGSIPARLEKWCSTDWSPAALPHSLLEALRVERDDFWSWHWTLRSARLENEQPLLGETRATDLAINVVLPWLWVRASEGRNEAMRRQMERIYFAWPRAEDNSVLKLARQRLLGGAGAGALAGAAAQQGLMQIVRDFCAQTNSICERCKLPQLVREWKQEGRDAGPQRRS